jgi:CubicO group peptidase (beta-lactamase class C family)
LAEPDLQLTMSRVLLPVVLAASLLVPTSAPAQADNPVLALLRDYIESLRIQTGIPGLAVAVVNRDAVVWEQAFGRQDIERSIATRTDTPFHLDALTQTVTAALVLRCVEEGRLSLDDRIGQFRVETSEPNATIRQLLTHTSGSTAAPAFEYRLDRLAPLSVVVRACAVESYRNSVANLFDRLAMRDSVPGPDVIRLVPPAEGIPEPEEAERYRDVLARLATPYFVDQQRRPLASQYPVTTLSPARGLISTVRDLAQFDLALRDGVILHPDTLALAWSVQTGGGQLLPHGLGWFVQFHNGEKIVWQFGVSERASSALIVTVPGRGLTYILLANSAGLVEPPPLTVSQLMASPFVRLLLGFFPG